MHFPDAQERYILELEAELQYEKERGQILEGQGKFYIQTVCTVKTGY